MEHLLHYERPDLESPVLIYGFSGWTDAAEAATHALRYLVKQLGATKFGEIDPEEFYDFTQVRPHTGFDREGERQITWPANEMFAWKGQPDQDDLMVFIGVEPSTRWRTFTETLLGVVKDLGVTRALQASALLDAVPHTRTPRVTGVATSPQVQELLRGIETRRSQYTGPTGMSGVLMDSLRRAGVPCVSVWGHAPHYLQVSPNPKVSLSLLQALEGMMKVHIDMEPLRSQGESFERRVAQAVANEPQVTEYVQRLEEEYDRRASRRAARQGHGEMPDPEEAVKDMEEFLKSQRQQDGSSDPQTTDPQP